jgi:alpha-ribazole phosphatase
VTHQGGGQGSARTSHDSVWITHAGVARAALLLSRGVAYVDQASDWPLDAPAFGAWWQLG